MWVKICGTTNLEDALLAADAGADAIGFVFAESQRKVDTGQARAIIEGLPVGIETIGVFVEAGAGEIAEIARECGLTGVQLHSGIGADASRRLRVEFGGELRILRVLHYEAGVVGKLKECVEDSSIDGVLVDSRTAAAVGGTGVRFDWEEARQKIFSGNLTTRLIAAGGLNAENVGDAIRLLQPWGVDVVTGVEAKPGKKDPLKIRAFIEAARATK